MKLLYVKEHLKCENYERSSHPVFENLFIEEGETVVKKIEEAEIIFVMDGRLNMYCNEIEFIYEKQNAILLPPATSVKISAVEDLKLVVLRINSPVHLCDIQPLSKIFEGDTPESLDHTCLPVNESIEEFLALLSKSLADGVRCKCFIELKSKEIFYYFRAYYKKETLREFFAPLFSNDYEFTVFVLQNYKKVKTVRQFADLYGYSLSCFEKQFKKIFGMSTYQWMTQKKSEAIYNALVYTDTSLIELSDTYDFSSLSQFCDFCKRVFGTSPGKIRSTGSCRNKFTNMVNR